jgi:CHAT domain-containing protein
VERLELDAGLVVLGACESGRADVAIGDEAIGLVRAFQVAGASRVLASLWPVDDAITTRFMTAFYGALRDGASASAALNAAQHAVRAAHPHPVHWGAFVLYGGW